MNDRQNFQVENCLALVLKLSLMLWCNKDQIMLILTFNNFINTRKAMAVILRSMNFNTMFSMLYLANKYMNHGEFCF